MPTKECKDMYQKYFPFWDKLTPDDRELLCQHSARSVYPKGSNVHGGSEGCTGAVVVNSGCLRAYMMSEEGKEITLYRLYPAISACCRPRAC